MVVEYFSFSLAHRIVAQALQYSFMEIKYNISIHIYNSSENYMQCILHHETDLDILTDLVSRLQALISYTVHTEYVRDGHVQDTRRGI